MGKLELEPDECLDQSDSLLHEEIRSFSGEYVVRLLLHYKDEVSGQSVRLNK